MVTWKNLILKYIDMKNIHILNKGYSKITEFRTILQKKKKVLCWNNVVLLEVILKLYEKDFHCPIHMCEPF